MTFISFLHFLCKFLGAIKVIIINDLLLLFLLRITIGFLFLEIIIESSSNLWRNFILILLFLGKGTRERVKIILKLLFNVTILSWTHTTTK